MSTPLAYRLRIRNEDDSADALVISSLKTDTYPYIRDVPTGDGSTLDPVAGKVTVGAYTVTVLDPVDTLTPETRVSESADDFEGYANTAALVAAWNATTTGGVTSHTVTLNTTDALAGSQCAEISILGNNTFIGGGFQLARIFTGLVPGGLYTASLQAQRISANLSYRVALRVAGNASPNLPNDASVHTLTASAPADGSGNLKVEFGYYYSATSSTPPATTVFDTLVLTGPDPLVPAPIQGRIVTSALADAAGRQQLLSRKAFLEFTTDLVTWENLVAAYVNSLRLSDAITYEFTIGESKRIEQAARVFDRISDPVAFPALIGVLDRASCIIGGPIVGDFALTNDRGRPVFSVKDSNTTVEGDTIVRLQWESGFLYHGGFHEGELPVENHNWFDGCADDYLDENAVRHMVGPRDPAGAFHTIAPLAGVVVRIYDPSTGAWLADHDATMDQDLGTKGHRYEFISEGGVISVRWLDTAPAEGTRYQLAVFPVEPSTRNPFHLSGHPVDLDVLLSTLKGITYDAVSAAAVKAALGADMVADLEITAGDTFEQWVTTNLRGPFGFTVRTDANGDREYITTRIRPAAVPTTVVTNADLLSDQGVVFSLDESSAAIKVTLETKSFRTTDERLDSTPIDSIRATKVTQDIDPADPVTIFGDREIRYTIPGSIRGLVTGTTENPGTLDLWAVAQYGPLFDWQGRGQITSEIQVRRGVVLGLVGDEIVLDLAHLPTASPDQVPTAQRGTTPRRCQILRRTEHPEGPTLLLLDRGPAVADEVGEDFPFPTCDTVTPPTDLAVSMVNTTATLTWVNGDATLPVEVSIKLATDASLIVVTDLPAGSTTYTFTLPAAETEYTFAVRHIDAPPLHCASATDEVNETTGALQTLQAPTDPAAFGDGKGTFGMSVQPTEPAANLEFWFAAETSAGSGVPDAYALYATKASLAGRTSAETGIAPNDGTLRYLIARHVEVGFTPSAFNAAVSINPWLLVPPVDPVPPVEPPLGLTILPVPITLITGSVPLGLREFPEAATRLTPWRGTEKLVPAAGATAAHIGASIISSTVPAGGGIVIKFQHPCSCEWLPLDGESGPILLVDTASLDAADTCAADAGDPWVVEGVPVTLTDEARTAVRFGAFGFGGTDTENLIISELTVWLTTQAADLPDPEMPEPPTEFPNECETAQAEDFEYADTAALLAAWPETDSAAYLTATLPSTEVYDGVAAVKLVAAPGGPYGADAYLSHTFTGYDPGQAVPVTLQVWLIRSPGSATANQVGFRANGVIGCCDIGAAAATWHEVIALVTADGSGHVVVQVGYFNMTAAVGFGGFTAYMDGLALCTPSTGIGDGGIDEVPAPPPGGYPPPPIGGARPFMIHNISSGGLGFWNGTVSTLVPSNTVAVLARATSNDCHLTCRHNGDDSKLDAAGRFSYALWQAQVDAVYNDATARAALEAAILSGAAWAHYLLDEPFHPRWGGISLQTMDRMATYSKSLYPTWRTLLRCSPNDARLTRAIANVDTYWAEYKLTNGDCAAYRDAVVAATEAFGPDVSVVLGIHYGAFPRSNSGIYITPAQLEHYGGILASSTSPAVAAMGGWKYGTAMNGQAGFPAAVEFVRDTFAALDP